MVPSDLYFVRNTHLQPTMLEEGGGGTSFQVRLWMRALNSVDMASRHSEKQEATVKELGSSGISREVVRQCRGGG